jgi:hypothetical protein
MSCGETPVPLQRTLPGSVLRAKQHPLGAKDGTCATGGKHSSNRGASVGAARSRGRSVASKTRATEHRGTSPVAIPGVEILIDGVPYVPLSSALATAPPAPVVADAGPGVQQSGATEESAGVIEGQQPVGVEQGLEGVSKGQDGDEEAAGYTAVDAQEVAVPETEAEAQEECEARKDGKERAEQAQEEAEEESAEGHADEARGADE